MARLNQRTDGTRELEIGDLALVVAVLGLAAAAVATTWIVTRDHRTLKQLTDLAAARQVRLLHHGRPLLP